MITSLTVFLTMLKEKWTKWLVIALFIIGALYVGANKVYNRGFDAGVAKQEAVQLQIQKQAEKDFKVLQAKADADRKTLNAKIDKLLAEKRSLKLKLDKKSLNIYQESVDYAKTNAGTLSCFAPRDDGLLIINKSFPTDSD